MMKDLFNMSTKVMSWKSSKKIWIICFFLCIFLWIIFYFNNAVKNYPLEFSLEYDGAHDAVHLYAHNKTYNISEIQCKYPQLNIWNPAIMKHFKSSPVITCDEESDWICLQNGTARICKVTAAKHGSVNCNFTFLERSTDLLTVDGDIINSYNSDPVLLPADFFRVKCADKESNTWQNIMAGVHFNKFIHDRSNWNHLSPKALKLNVFIWGFDSLSRLTFIRKLPKTFEYLTKSLDAITLQGYNIVGDGTLAALIPILTGKTEAELPDVRKKMVNSQHLNVYPFIWKDYESTGYVTAYAEDAPYLGTFTYRLKGFGIQPTDHYMRTFYVAAEKEYSDHKIKCLRGTPRHKVLMNWVQQYFEVYTDKPKFLFSFHSELSHEDYNAVGSTDDDLRDMLKLLYEKKYLMNTILIVMSDHGHRFSSFRETQQGKQEERLPFFSMVFPKWFKEQYPTAHENLLKNQFRLTTPFDIYSTLRDVLHLDITETKGNIEERSISLFKEVPVERTCSDASIQPHWCACLNKRDISTTDIIAIKAAEAVVEFINRYTQKNRNSCEVLSLHSVLKALKYIPTEDLLSFKKNMDYDEHRPDLSDHTSISTEMYEIQLQTIPGKGLFEATVVFHVQRETFSLKRTDISRINKYGRDAICIEQVYPDLRQFCYCKRK